MEQLNNKVERYIILSKQFQKPSSDIFGKESLQNISIGYTTCEGSISYRVTTEQVKEKSRAEKIRENAEIQAKLAEDYDEYLQLQKDLGNYYSSLNKLTN